HLVMAHFAEQFLQRFAVFKLHGDVDFRRDELLVEVDLLEQRAEKYRLVVFELVFPEELAAIHDLAVAQGEQVERHQRGLGVDGEDIDVVAFGGGHFLALFDLFHGGDQIAQSGGFLEARVSASGLHTHPHIARQIGVAALQKEADVVDGGGVGVVGSESLDAGPQAAVNMELQAGVGVKTGEVYLAGGDPEVAVDEVHQAVRQVGGEVGAEVGGAVLAQSPGHVDARVLFVGQLDVGESLVVAQQDVEARLVLLDEVVFEGEGFLPVSRTAINKLDDFSRSYRESALQPSSRRP